MRGELDWIVMKALEKDRNRRYETANGLAADLRRYLDDEPVQACPPSAGYRLRKLVRRHRRPVLAAALVLLALLAGVVGTTWGLIRAEQARLAEAGQHALAEANEQKALEQKRIAEAVRTFLQQDLLRQADPVEQANAVRQAGGGFETTENPTIKELLDRAAAELMPGKIEAKFPQQREVQASILQTVGATYLGIGEFAKAVEFLMRSSDTYRHAFGADHPDTLGALDKLAEGVRCYRESGRGRRPVRARARRSCEDARGRPPRSHSPPLITWPRRTSTPGRCPRPSPCSSRCATLECKQLGPDHPDTLVTLHSLAEGAPGRRRDDQSHCASMFRSAVSAAR